MSQIPSIPFRGGLLGRAMRDQRAVLNKSLPSMSRGSVVGGPAGVALLPRMQFQGGAFLATIVAATGGEEDAPCGGYWCQPGIPSVNLEELGEDSTNAFTLNTNPAGSAIFNGQPILVFNIGEIYPDIVGMLAGSNTNLLNIGDVMLVFPVQGLLNTSAGQASATIYMGVSGTNYAVPCDLNKTGGSNGTYPAGGSTTPASYTYTAAINGITVGTAMTVTWARSFGGNTTAATHGWLQIGSNSTYTLLFTDESQTGDVCAS